MIQTSFHGLGTALSVFDRKTRLLWFAIFLSGFVMFLYPVTRSIVDFLGNEAVINRRIEDIPVPFPAITICNLNAYKRNLIGKVPKLAALTFAFEELMLELAVKNAQKYYSDQTGDASEIEKHEAAERDKRSAICPDIASLADSINASLSYSHPNMSNVGNLVSGSFATFVCNEVSSYQRNGSLECDELGNWIGSLPNCTGMCPDIASLADSINANLSYSHPNMSNAGNLVSGSIANFVCNEVSSYQRNGSLECDDLGNWIGSLPNCTGMCPDIASLADSINASLSYSHPNMSNAGNLVSGSIANFVCNEVSSLQHNSSLECDELGNWIGSLPNCTAMCPDIAYLADSINANVSYSHPNMSNVGHLVFGSIANFVCNEISSYQRNGSIECNELGKWIGSLPNCTAMCPSIASLVETINANVTYSYQHQPIEALFKFGTNAIIMCKEGYIQNGSILECDDPGGWLGRMPTCIAVCPDIRFMVALKDGNVSYTYMNILITENLQAGSIANITCKKNLTLLGSSILKCDEQGNWIDKFVNCTLLCTNINDRIARHHAQIFYHNPILVGTIEPGGTATVVCNNGYKQVGNGHLECDESGVWTSDLPDCIDWEKEFVIAAPGVNCQEACYWNRYESYCSFSDTANWNLFNHLLPAILHLRNSTNVTLEHSTAVQYPEILISNDGVFYIGWNLTFNSELFNCSALPSDIEHQRVCQCHNTFWGNVTVNHTSSIRCSVPDEPNIQIQYWPTKVAKPGTVANFACERFYKLHGHAILTCMGSGEWSHSVPSCTRSPYIFPIAGEGLSCSSACQNEWYDYVCDFTEFWNVQSPDQIKNFALNFYFIENYNQIRPNDHKVSNPIRYSLFKTTTTTTTISLSSQSSIPLKSNIGIFPYMQRIRTNLEKFYRKYEDNYAIFGWNIKPGDEPSCETSKPGAIRFCQCKTYDDSIASSGKLCPRIEEFVENSNVLYSHEILEAGIKAGVTCVMEYKLIGASSLTCSNDGHWSKALPICEPTNTVLLFATENTCNEECQIYRYDAVCDFTDFWNITDPWLYFNIMNQEIRDHSTNFYSLSFLRQYVPSTYEQSLQQCYRSPHSFIRYEQSKCTYENGISYCYFDKQLASIVGWRPQLLQSCDPICESNFNSKICQCKLPFYGNLSAHSRHTDVACPDIINFINGSIKYNLFYAKNISIKSLGTIAYMVCNNGYDLIGSAALTCTFTGNWSDSFPKCRRHSITYHLAYPNQDCNLHCSLVHPLAKCDFDGFWNVTDKYEIYTRFYNLIDRSLIRMSSYFYDWLETNSTHPYFDTNFSPKGWIRYGNISSCEGENSTSYRLCPCRGLYWGNSDPRETETNTCLEFGKLENGNVMYFPEGPKFTGTVVRTTCNDGYDLIGTSTFTCMYDGVWTGGMPSCKKTNRYYTLSKHSQSCSDACKSLGSNFLCDFSNFWKNAETDYTEIQNKLLEIKSNKSNPITRTILHVYAQNEMYPLVDDNRGIEGYYPSNPMDDPSCDAVAYSSSRRICLCKYDQCSAINHTVSNGFYQYLGPADKIGTDVQFGCDKGYRLRETTFRFCNDSALWEEPIPDPECLDLPCSDSPDTIANAVISYSNESLPKGSIANISCLHGYAIVGPTTIICSRIAEWFPGFPKCIQCERIIVINTVIEYSDDYKIGSTATIQCDIGFKLIGANETTCNSTAQWDNDFPNCENLVCDQSPSSIKNADIVYANNNREKGTTVSITCLKGYVLIGLQLLFCSSSAIWNEELPRCEPLACDASPDSIDNAVVTYSDNARPMGAEVIITCLRGFQIIGSSVLYCNSTANWDSELPQCEPLPCDESPSTINNAVATYSDTLTRKGSIVNISCVKDYELIGFQILTCNSTANWNGSLPFCRSLTCDLSPDNIKNADIKYSDKTRVINSNVTVYCHPGFSLVGYSTLQCNSGSVWNDPMPQCIDEVCDSSLELIENAVVRYSNETKSKGTIATITCDDEFQIIGQHELTCIESAVWQAPPPVCQGLSTLQVTRCDQFVTCYHNASCKEENHKFYCLCAEGFKGLYCEHKIDDCQMKPCRGEKSVCIDRHLGYRCDCEPGRRGAICEIDIDECATNHCDSSLSRCHDNLNDHMCISDYQITFARTAILDNLDEVYKSFFSRRMTHLHKLKNNSRNSATLSNLLSQATYSYLNKASNKAMSEATHWNASDVLEAYLYGTVERNPISGFMKSQHETSDHTSYQYEQDNEEINSASLTTTVNSMLPFLMEGIDLEIKKSIGFTKSDLIKFCMSKGNPNCDWGYLYNHRYGNCYTYNFNDSDVVKMDRTGANEGVSIVLDSKPKDFLPFTESVGLLLTLHNQGIMPYPENEGFTITPGYATSYATKHVQILRNQELQQSCVSDENPVQPLYYNAYSIGACQKSDLQYKIATNCSCNSPQYASSHFKLPDCKMTQKACVDKMEAGTINTSYYHCHPPCLETVFKIVSSQTSRIRAMSSGCNIAADPTCMFEKDIASINVYFDSLRTEVYEEARKHSLSTLLSNIGGLLGLLIGGSVISLVELFFILMECVQAI